jgi:hypothetical protein
MDLAKLKAEIATDPAVLGYATFMPGDPEHVASLLNAPRFSALKSITAATALTWAAQGPYSAIVDASNNISHPCRASCLVVRDTLSAGLTVHMEDPALQNMFGAWKTVAPAIITQAQYDALIAIATQPASRAEILGLGPVTARNIVDSGAA